MMMSGWPFSHTSGMIPLACPRMMFENPECSQEDGKDREVGSKSDQQVAQSESDRTATLFVDGRGVALRGRTLGMGGRGELEK